MGLFLTSHLSIFSYLEMGAIEIALYYQIHRLVRPRTQSRGRGNLKLGKRLSQGWDLIENALMV